MPDYEVAVTVTQRHLIQLEAGSLDDAMQAVKDGFWNAVPDVVGMTVADHDDPHFEVTAAGGTDGPVWYMGSPFGGDDA